MNEKDYSPLTLACVRALRDKLPDKRKIAVIEIERMVKDFITVKNHIQIKKIIEIIGKEFINSQSSHAKRGGLMAIATVAIALGNDSQHFIDAIITPIISCFCDYEPNIRYSACESLYNVIKTLRGTVLPHFSKIFDSLTRLVSDTDSNVRNAAETLDKSLKDIVMDSAMFDLITFIDIVKERIYSRDPLIKEFIITWISLLDAVPNIDLIPFLPNLLDGLFIMLKDSSNEIRKTCETILGEFRRKIKKNPSKVQFGYLINILIMHAQSKEELLQLTAIIWIKDFLEISNVQMLPHVSGIFSAILPCLAYNTDFGKQIKENATAINEILMQLIAEHVDDSNNKDQLDLNAMINSLSMNLDHYSVESKVAVLKWIHHLIGILPQKIMSYKEQFFPTLLTKLSDPSNKVVQENLEVLAEIILKNQNDDSYSQFLTHLLQMFRNDRKILELRASFIIRKLCVLLSSELIYKSLAEALLNETDLQFACLMVEVLNLILLTAPELLELRNRLKNLQFTECRKLFCCIYKSWSHSPIATVALCLLTRNYMHTYNLIRSFVDIEITVEFLIEIDKLIQLIESPVFAFLRLDLLENPCDQYLLKSLYGLLMLLPQSEAFHLLRNRLQCVPHCCLQKNTPLEDLLPERMKDIDFDELIDHFKNIQQKHRINKQRISEKELINSLDVIDFEEK